MCTSVCAHHILFPEFRRCFQCHLTQDGPTILNPSHIMYPPPGHGPRPISAMISGHIIVVVGKRCYGNRMLWTDHERPGGRLKNAYELLNLRALKISMLYKIHIFQCMGKIFCVEFQRVPLKFHTKYHTHTLKDVDFIHGWKFKSS